MKKTIAMIIGLAIFLIMLIIIFFGNDFTFSNQTLLKSPKIDIPESTVNTSVASYINNEKVKQTNNTNISNGVNESNMTTNSNSENSNYNNEINKSTSSQKASSENQSVNDVNELSHLIESGGVLYGYVADGAYLIIPCSQGIIVNGKLSVPEYYVGMPWEKFNDYISIKNGEYIIQEYYDGKQTGEFNLTSSNKGLSGTFTHVTDNTTYNAKFTCENGFKSGSLAKKPFYIGVIGNTAVTLTNKFNGAYSEYYHGDKHLFNVVKENSTQNPNYNIQLNEYYGNVLTGEYLLNSVGNDTYTGIFITKPNSANSVRSTVGLTGSFSPFSI